MFLSAQDGLSVLGQDEQRLRCCGFGAEGEQVTGDRRQQLRDVCCSLDIVRVVGGHVARIVEAKCVDPTKF